MNKSLLLKFMNFYPPYLGAGVRIKHIAFDFSEISVEMKLRFWNKNYVGTHFGGSLYSMIDPFYMLMLIEILGKNYIVWDKEATIKFKRPGRNSVRATFKISPEQIEKIKEELEVKEKINPQFSVDIFSKEGELVATALKTLHISKKQRT